MESRVNGPDFPQARQGAVRLLRATMLAFGAVAWSACSPEIVSPPAGGTTSKVPDLARSFQSGTSSALTSSLAASVAFGQSALPIHRANDINDAGLVVGDVEANNVAAYWTQSGGLVVVGQVVTGSRLCCSTFADLNEASEAVGTSSLNGGITLTKFTFNSLAYVNLPTSQGRNFAQGINDSGEITAFDDHSGGRPYYRPAAGGPITMLSFAPAFFSGLSTDINNSAIITGYLFVVGVGYHAVAWPEPTAAPVDLGTLGGNQSQAHAINVPGDIVGWSEITPGNSLRHATLWPASGGMVDLHSWPNACPGSSEASDVSDIGVIIGRCNGRPVIWTAVEGMRYLPMPAGATLAEPRAINNENTIVGTHAGNFGGLMWRMLNAPPQANAGGPYTGLEGTAVALDGTASTDPDGDELTYTWDFGDGTTGSSATPEHTYVENGEYLVSLTVTDAHGVESQPVATTATIGNVAPKLGGITGPPEPIALEGGSATAQFSGAFTDPGALDTHNGSLACDGGVAGSVSISESGGSGNASGSCVFSTPGVYSISMTVTDDDGAQDSETFQQYVVVYDPTGGFVTGGGWISSPAGAYAADVSLTGKATFGFVSRYQRGASIPSGNTEFQFHAGSFNFSSTSYQWLVVAGSRAQYKGSGTVNGLPGYGFLLSAVDGQQTGGDGVDRFRIKVWDLSSGTTVYDNVAGSSDDIDLADPQSLGGGSISIRR